MYSVPLFLVFACILCTQAQATLTQPPIQPFIYSTLVPDSNTTSYPTRRQDHGLAFIDNSLYLLGGVDPTSATATYVTEVWALDTAHNTWNHTSLTLKRAKHCVAQNGSLVYIIGGEGNDTSSFASWNLTSGVWTELAALPATHNLFSACAIWGHAVVVFGGCDKNGACSNKLDLFWANESKWQVDLPAAPVAVGGASLNILQSGKHSIGVVIGGADGGNRTEANVFFYNFTNKTWASEDVTTLPHLTHHTSVTTGAGNLIVFGGEVGGVSSGVTYYITVNATSLSFNVTLPKFNQSNPSPSARLGHAAIYAENRMLIYGGDYKMGEIPSFAWQLATEVECLVFHTCGECLLAGCYWCSPNSSSYCVAGSITPFVEETCTELGWNHSSLLNCRQPHPAAPWLVAVTVVVLVVIAILVVATYVVDYRKGKANSSVYEPIGM